MSDISIYLKPFSESVFYAAGFNNKRLGHQSLMYLEKGSFPDYSLADMAIIGVPDMRGYGLDAFPTNGPDQIRSYLYKLYSPLDEVKICDLGNVVPGNEVSDTCFALTEICTHLLEKGIVPILLGGTQDLTFPLYNAYENLGQIINIASIDPTIDLGGEDDSTDAESWVSKIILQQPSYLFNYTNIGYQSYGVDSCAVSLIKEMNFDAYRLGFVSDNLNEIEPMIRNVDILSVDMCSVRQSDAPGAISPEPNGFYGEQLCQIMRFAGMSDKLTSLGLFNYNPAEDQRGQTAHLMAQMIWYFIEGFYNRLDDFPTREKSNNYYVKYHVKVDGQEEELVFYKSKKSDRWWMEVACPAHLVTKYARHYIVPCSFSDYQVATTNDIPERWWQVYQKIM